MKLEMTPESKNKTIDEGFDEFIRYCKIRNLSETTIENYKYALYSFGLFCPTDIPLDSVNKEILDGYILFLKENYDLADASLAIRIKNIRAIINYLFKLGYIEQFELPKIKCDKKIKETYNVMLPKIIIFSYDKYTLPLAISALQCLNQKNYEGIVPGPDFGYISSYHRIFARHQAVHFRFNGR